MNSESIIAIDPGTLESAVLVWKENRVVSAVIMKNEDLGLQLKQMEPKNLLAIEMIASFGMPVGKEVFETCLWIGRFMEIWDWRGGEVTLCYRRDIKLHLCNSARAKDANVAQALRDKLGEVGTVKNPGPLFGIKSHLWSALAVAVYAYENR